MHRDVYQVVRPPSCLTILIKNMSILRKKLLKLRYFVRQTQKSPLTRYRKKLVVRKDYQLKVSMFLAT